LVQVDEPDFRLQIASFNAENYGPTTFPDLRVMTRHERGAPQVVCTAHLGRGEQAQEIHELHW
jgi:hypothetical protein